MPLEVVSSKQLTIINDELLSVNGEDFQEEYPSQYLTVAEAFAFIEEQLNKSPHITRITYDKTYGFPAAFYFDFEEAIADEELSYTFSDFTILPVN